MENKRIVKEWTEEEVIFIKDNIDILTFSAMAKHLNRTKGSVVSYCSRYEIKKNAKKLSTKYGKRQQTTKDKVVFIAKLKILDNPKSKKPTGGVDMINLRHNQCAAIIGEPRFACCCGKNVFQGSYCKAHAKEYYMPPEELNV